ncbi:unnamed protein product [Sphacelaria rigidula]
MHQNFVPVLVMLAVVGGGREGFGYAFSLRASLTGEPSRTKRVSQPVLKHDPVGRETTAAARLNAVSINEGAGYIAGRGGEGTISPVSRTILATAVKRAMEGVKEYLPSEHLGLLRRGAGDGASAQVKYCARSPSGEGRTCDKQPPCTLQVAMLSASPW